MGISRFFKRYSKKKSPALIEATADGSSFTVVPREKTEVSSFVQTGEEEEISTKNVDTDGVEISDTWSNNTESLDIRKSGESICETSTEKNYNQNNTHYTDFNIQKFDDKTSHDAWFVEDGEEVPQLSITVSEKLRQISIDPAIPQEIRLFVRSYLEKHSNISLCDSKSDTSGEKIGVAEVPVAVPLARTSVQKVRPASFVRKMPLHKTHSLVAQNRNSVFRPSSMATLQFELDWPFYLHNQIVVEDPDVRSPAMQPTNYTSQQLMNNSVCTESHHVPLSSGESMPRLQKIDSVSSISSMGSHSSLSSQSNAPSLTHTTTTTCSKYSTITEQDYDVMSYKHTYSADPVMVEPSTRCSTYHPGFTTTRRSKNPSQNMNMEITSNKSRPVTYQKKIELDNPNAYCGSTAMAGPYPCIPNRKSVRNGAFRRLSGVIPTVYHNDE